MTKDAKLQALEDELAAKQKAHDDAQAALDGLHRGIAAAHAKAAFQTAQLSAAAFAVVKGDAAAQRTADIARKARDAANVEAETAQLALEAGQAALDATEKPLRFARTAVEKRQERLRVLAHLQAARQFDKDAQALAGSISTLLPFLRPGMDGIHEMMRYVPSSICRTVDPFAISHYRGAAAGAFSPDAHAELDAMGGKVA